MFTIAVQDERLRATSSRTRTRSRGKRWRSSRAIPERSAPHRRGAANAAAPTSDDDRRRHRRQHEHLLSTTTFPSGTSPRPDADSTASTSARNRWFSLSLHAHLHDRAVRRDADDRIRLRRPTSSSSSPSPSGRRAARFRGCGGRPPVALPEVPRCIRAFPEEREPRGSHPDRGAHHARRHDLVMLGLYALLDRRTSSPSRRPTSPRPSSRSGSASTSSPGSSGRRGSAGCSSATRSFRSRTTARAERLHGPVRRLALRPEGNGRHRSPRDPLRRQVHLRFRRRHVQGNLHHDDCGQRDDPGDLLNGVVNFPSGSAPSLVTGPVRSTSWPSTASPKSFGRRQRTT